MMVRTLSKAHQNLTLLCRIKCSTEKMTRLLAFLLLLAPLNHRFLHTGACLGLATHWGDRVKSQIKAETSLIPSDHHLCVPSCPFVALVSAQHLSYKVRRLLHSCLRSFIPLLVLTESSAVHHLCDLTSEVISGPAATRHPALFRHTVLTVVL